MRPYVGCFFLGGAPMTLRNLFEHDINDIKKMIHDDPPPKKKEIFASFWRCKLGIMIIVKLICFLHFSCLDFSTRPRSLG